MSKNTRFVAEIDCGDEMPPDYMLDDASALTQTVDSHGDEGVRFCGNGPGSLRHRQRGGSRPPGGDH